MKIGILGTGMVGQTLATKLVALDHEVVMGAREAKNQNANDWAQKTGGKGRAGTFADAAAHGELLLNCTMGQFSIEALRAAGREHLRGKVLIDVSNPLDFSKGMPPTLFVCNDDSLGERIQNAFPELRVVKALNTVNAGVMVDPSRVPGESTMMIAGDDADAKVLVASLLQSFGWKDILDLGELTAARTLEMYVMLWVRLWGTVKTADFNVKVVR